MLKASGKGSIGASLRTYFDHVAVEIVSEHNLAIKLKASETDLLVDL